MDDAAAQAVAGAADRVLDLASARAATLGGGRLVCVDGPAGSGKTSLAEAVAARHRRALVLHTDDLLEGWAGLPGLAGTLERLLHPLAAGSAGTWRRWDWHADGWAETHRVEPLDGRDLLVVEGVGSGSPSLAGLTTVLVWVAAPRALRLDRGLARDGEAMREHWSRWSVAEDALHDRDRTAARADLVVDGTTGAVSGPASRT